MSPFLLVVAVGMMMRVVSYGTHSSQTDFVLHVENFEVQPMTVAEFGRSGTRVVVDFAAEGVAPNWWKQAPAQVERTRSGDMIRVHGRKPTYFESGAERIGPEFVRPGLWRVEYRFKQTNLQQQREELRLRNSLRFPSKHAQDSQSIVLDLPLTDK